MTKQVIVLRDDLNMRKGKMVGQGAHASNEVLLSQMERAEIEDGYTLTLTVKNGSYMARWLAEYYTKICLSVNSEEALLALYNEAIEMGIPASLITDMGLTEFKGVQTKTAIAIGPHDKDEINKLTGSLKLL